MRRFDGRGAVACEWGLRVVMAQMVERVLHGLLVGDAAAKPYNSRLLVACCLLAAHAQNLALPVDFAPIQPTILILAPVHADKQSLHFLTNALFVPHHELVQKRQPIPIVTCAMQ